METNTELFYTIIGTLGLALILGALIALIMGALYEVSIYILNRLGVRYGSDRGKYKRNQLTGFYKNTFKS